MTLLSPQMCYGILAIEDIRASGITSSARIAARNRLAPGSVRRAMRQMMFAGILKGFRGTPGGGYVLDKKVITLYDIHNAMHKRFWIEAIPDEIAPLINPRLQVDVEAVYVDITSKLVKIIV